MKINNWPMPKSIVNNLFKKTSFNKVTIILKTNKTFNYRVHILIKILARL